MKKRMLFFLAFAGCMGQNVSAQDGWVKRTEGLETAPGTAAVGDIDIGVESRGVYIAGAFRGSKDFDPGAGVDMRSTSGGIAGPSDMYAQRLSSSGDVIWTVNLGGDTYDAAYGIVTDNSENSYIIGVFTGTVDFDPGPDVASLTATEGLSSFVLKLDISGNFLWVTQKEDILRGIDVDQEFVYITGKQDGGIFIEKMSQFDASIVWSFTLDASEGEQEGIALGLDNLDNIYVTGNAFGEVDFDPSAGISIAGFAGSKTFLAKYTSTGDLVWVHALGQYGGVLSEMKMVDLFVDKDGYTYSAGKFTGQVNLDHTGGDVVTTGPQSPFVRKCNPDGTYGWGGSFTITDIGDVFAEPYSITMVHNTVYLFGDFSGPLAYRTGSFGDNTGSYHTITPGGAQDVFLYAMDTAGTHIRMGQITGPDAQYGSTVESDQYGTLYLAGGFMGTTDFDPYFGTHFEGSIDGDAYVTKMDGYVSLEEQPEGMGFSVYPNPTEDALVIAKEGAFTYHILSMKGQVLREGSSVDGISIDMNPLSSGAYLLKIQSDNSLETVKVIKK